jgi:hypothetical protein
MVKVKNGEVVSVHKYYAMKAYGGMDVHIHDFLTSALVGSEWSASRLCRFTLGQRAPGTHWIGGWVGTKAGYGPYRDSNSELSAVQAVASRYTDWATAADKENGVNLFNLHRTVLTEHIINKDRQMYYLPLPQMSHVQLQWLDSCRHKTQSQRNRSERATVLSFNILQIYFNKSHTLYLSRTIALIRQCITTSSVCMLGASFLTQYLPRYSVSYADSVCRQTTICWNHKYVNKSHSLGPGTERRLRNQFILKKVVMICSNTNQTFSWTNEKNKI